MYRQRRKCGIECCHWLGMPPPPTNGQESKDYDQSSSHRLSVSCLQKKSTIRLHGRNLLQELSIGS